MEQILNVLCLSSSIRKTSCNTGVLRYILSLSPAYPQVRFELFPIQDLPMYNGDFDPTELRRAAPQVKGWPEIVQSLRDKAEKANLLLFCINEHNHNVSPCFLNAISWGSRAEKVLRDGKEVTIQPIFGKKIGLVSAAGKSCGLDAQEILRKMDTLRYEYIDLKSGPLGINCYTPGNFDANGDVLDEGIKGKLNAFTDNLINEITKK